METHHLPVRPENGEACVGSGEGMREVTVVSVRLVGPLKRPIGRKSSHFLDQQERRRAHQLVSAFPSRVP